MRIERREDQERREREPWPARRHGFAGAAAGTVPQLTVLADASRPAATPHGPADTLGEAAGLLALHQAMIPSAPIPNAPAAINLSKGARCASGKDLDLSMIGRTSSRTT